MKTWKYTGDFIFCYFCFSKFSWNHLR